MKKPMDNNIKERGEAGMIIELKEGIITVEHIEGGNLVKWVANEGDWNRLWDTINLLKGGII